MKWAVLTLNRQSISLARRLNSHFPVDIYTLDKYLDDGLFLLEGGLKKSIGRLFNKYDVLIFVMAMGIIVRDIGPFIKHKSLDPAVLCMSVDGKFIIPVLSGHLGGANKVAADIAHKLSITPVITTASDLLNKKAVDMIALENDLIITSFEDAKSITASIIDNEKIEIVSQVKTSIKNRVKWDDYNEDDTDGIILISYKKQHDINIPFVQLIPRILTLGIGCRRDTPFEKIYSFLTKLLKGNNIDIRAIKNIRSIDIKKDEVGIIKLSQKLKAVFKTYTATELGSVVEKFEQSDFVKKTVGVGAVSMPSGYLGSNRGRNIISKQKYEGITISIWEETT